MRGANTKVYGIGLQKTGLTSLLNFMLNNGYSATGRSRPLHNLFHAGRYEEVVESLPADKFDFRCDWPIPLLYKLIFKRFGKNVKFILTVRNDPQKWFASLKRHNAHSHPFRNKHKWTFKRYYPHGFEAEHLAYYERYVAEVIRFFRENDAEEQLLVVDVTQSDSVQKLSMFLDIDPDGQVMPHENKSSERVEQSPHRRFRQTSNRIILWVYERVAPMISPKSVQPQHPIEPDEILAD